MAPGPDPAAPAPAPAPPGLLPAALLMLLMLLPALLGAAPGAPPPPAASAASAAEGLAIPICVAPAPSLACSLDRREGGGGGGRRLERTLRNCSAEASLLLEVQFQTELIQTEEEEEEEEEGGSASSGPRALLALLLEAPPAAQITWTEPDASDASASGCLHLLLVLLDAKTFPWPPEQTLRLRLQVEVEVERSLRSHEAHARNASLPLPGLLSARVELPLGALVLGCAGALGGFVCLGSVLGCLLCRTRRAKEGKAAAAGAPFLVPLPPRDPNRLKPRMPRANTSLPANLRLNSLSAEAKGRQEKEKAAGDAPPVEQEEERALSEPENRLVLVERGGLGRFPMVGYIYRASSMSSDEIWL